MSNMSDNARKIAEQMCAGNERPLDEEVKAVPAASRVFSNHIDAELLALVEKISKLGNGKAILRRKRMTTEQIGSVRYLLQLDYGYRLIVRTRPGETYFWRGEHFQEPADDKHIIRTRIVRRTKRSNHAES